jgi:flagellar biosynthesis chaperone FliJ
MDSKEEKPKNTFNEAFGELTLANTDVRRTRDFLKNLQSSYRYYQKEIVKYKSHLKYLNDFCKRHNFAKSQMPWDRIKDYLNAISYYKNQLNNCQKQIVKTRQLLKKYETLQNIAYNGCKNLDDNLHGVTKD